jgi:N-acetylglutamate synthase/N-acetylornithine aminotransferase
MAVEFNEKKQKALLDKKECKITIDLKSGKQWQDITHVIFLYDLCQS